MTQNIVKNTIGNVASSYQVNLAIEIPNITENYINSHVFTCRHWVSPLLIQIYVTLLGSFFDWPDIFLIGKARKKSEYVGKTRYEISYITYFSNEKAGIMIHTEKHRLGTVSKNILLEGLNRFNGAPTSPLVQMWIKSFIWEVYRRINGQKFSFTVTRDQSRKT